MVYRITPQQITLNAVRFSQARMKNLAVLQEQISSGLRVARPSDDPGSIAPLLANRATINRIEIDVQNMQVARSKLNQSVSQLTSVTAALRRASDLGLAGVQSLEIERETLANEVDGILNSIVEAANASEGGRALYGGTNNDPRPFRVDSRDSEGRIQTVNYYGSDERARIVIGVNSSVDVNYVGSEVFRSDSRAKTVFVGDTGAVPGTGTDSGLGQGQLELRHTATVFGGASGLQPGTSTAQDTILGDHTLSVDAVQGTLRLDGGITIEFTPGDTNVRVVTDGDRVVHVDTSGLVAGFVGDITIQGQGTLSTDLGATQVPIDFSANQVVLNSVTGQVTNVDTRAVQKAGVEQVDYRGTPDVFQALVELRDELLNRRDLSPQEWADAMGRRIEEVQRVHDDLLDVIGEQSVSLENLDAVETRTEDLEVELKISLSDLESADIAEAAVRLQAEQTALQFTYAATTRLMDTSLLDFLR